MSTKLQRTQLVCLARSVRRSGFTLVEMLVVISIIGLLVGLTVPAVMMARTAVQRAAIVFEVQTLGNAIEQYKTKYGDYPPDGSDSPVFERHFRKAFPNIAASELAIFTQAGVANCANSAYPNSIMDPAEALVFALGGFSSDPAHPFTGAGGPFFVSNGAVQYNVDRNSPLFEFKQDRLTVDTSTGSTLSTDEVDLFGLAATQNDVLPVYKSGNGRLAPFVYFDSRTYSKSTTNGAFLYNVYDPSTVGGLARPYKSDDINTKTTNPDAKFRYANDRTFQIISAGLDDDFGGVLTKFFCYPSGNSLVYPGPPESARYSEGSGPSAQLDNATNFADGILEDALEN